MRTKLLILILLFILSVKQSKAQDNDQPKWEMEIYGGGNIPNKANDRWWNAKTGYHAGIHIDYYLNEYLFVRSGLGYTTKGSNTTRKGETILTDEDNRTYTDISKMKTKYTFSYLNVPLDLGVKVQMENHFALILTIGFYAENALSMKTSLDETHRYIYEDTGETLSAKTKESSGKWDKTRFKRFDFGASFGVGGQYKRFTFLFRYERGMLNIGKKSEDNKLFNDWKNRNASFSIGYKFFMK